MSHIDTLKVYRAYKKAGLDDAAAESYTEIIENSFMTKVNDLKGDFASNKLITFLGSLIIGIGSFTLVKVWDLSHDMIEVKTRLAVLEERTK